LDPARPSSPESSPSQSKVIFTEGNGVIHSFVEEGDGLDRATNKRQHSEQWNPADRATPAPRHRGKDPLAPRRHVISFLVTPHVIAPKQKQMKKLQQITRPNKKTEYETQQRQPHELGFKIPTALVAGARSTTWPNLTPTLRISLLVEPVPLTDRTK